MEVHIVPVNSSCGSLQAMISDILLGDLHRLRLRDD
jgi:hypothetical protein